MDFDTWNPAGGPDEIGPDRLDIERDAELDERRWEEERAINESYRRKGW